MSNNAVIAIARDGDTRIEIPMDPETAIRIGAMFQSLGTVRITMAEAMKAAEEMEIQKHIKSQLKGSGILLP